MKKENPWSFCSPDFAVSSFLLVLVLLGAPGFGGCSSDSKNTADSTSSAALLEDTAVHPEPVDPVYLPKSWYSELKSKTAPPPEATSQVQARDEKELMKWQGQRTAADCERAGHEVTVSVENFFAEPQGPLPAESLQAVSDMAERVKNDGNYFIQLLKTDFARPRPFNYLADLQPCILKERTLSYPSGHAAASELYALFLSDVFPKKAAQIEARGSANCLGSGDRWRAPSLGCRERSSSGGRYLSSAQAASQLSPGLEGFEKKVAKKQKLIRRFPPAILF